MNWEKAASYGGMVAGVASVLFWAASVELRLGIRDDVDALRVELRRIGERLDNHDRLLYPVLVRLEVERTRYGGTSGGGFGSGGTWAPVTTALPPPPPTVSPDPDPAPEPVPADPDPEQDDWMGATQRSAEEWAERQIRQASPEFDRTKGAEFGRDE